MNWSLHPLCLGSSPVSWVDWEPQGTWTASQINIMELIDQLKFSQGTDLECTHSFSVTHWGPSWPYTLFIASYLNLCCLFLVQLSYNCWGQRMAMTDWRQLQFLKYMWMKHFWRYLRNGLVYWEIQGCKHSRIDCETHAIDTDFTLTPHMSSLTIMFFFPLVWFFVNFQQAETQSLTRQHFDGLLVNALILITLNQKCESFWFRLSNRAVDSTADFNCKVNTSENSADTYIHNISCLKTTTAVVCQNTNI